MSESRGPGTWDMRPGTWDLRPGTWDLGVYCGNLGPGPRDIRHCEVWGQVRWFISLVFRIFELFLKIDLDNFHKNPSYWLPDFTATLFLYFIFISFCLFCTFLASNLARQHALFAQHRAPMDWFKINSNIHNWIFPNVRADFSPAEVKTILQNKECKEWMTGMM